MNSQAISLYKKRRSQYALGKNLPVSQDQVTQVIKQAIRETPSSFNSQSTRSVILFGEHSVKFWELTKEELRKIVPAEAFASTEQKINGFAAGAGTVLFFVDTQVIKQQQEHYPLYADNFPLWGEHANGMAQFAVWTALADVNIGASLQHYNPLVDEAVREQWAFDEKAYIEDEQRFRVFSS